MPEIEPATFPDLLYPSPQLRIDFEKTRLALSLAFAGGVSGGLFEETLASATLEPSSWEPTAFENDLFLRRFVGGCFKIRVGREEGPVAGSHLVRLLTHPPSDVATVEHRRAILAELDASPELRARLEELYRALRRLRILLENASGVRNWDPSRRQLDMLVIVKEVFDLMAGGFGTSRSGLCALSVFGGRIVTSEAYRSLADLLRYDDRLATLSLKVGVGADGRIRGFEVMSIAEDAENPFVSPPWRRWLAKLELFARGYRFSDGEVMTRLVDAVFVGLESDLVTLLQLFGDLEFYLGALGFADQSRAAGLAVCLPELVAPDAPRALHDLFNPLLLMSGIEPIPCELTSSRLATTVLVTGPNSGGKTRLLQSVGLTQLLAQAGCFIPARAGAVSLTSALVVSLIQETRADQAEGRLGMELLRIRELFERLPPGAMVLLDELCSGTNPSEGEEIFELVVEMLSKLSPQAFITTHFLTFAARLEREKKIPDLTFVQVELGADRRATYQFVPGVATTSLAGHAAERLGVTGEQLLSLIERNVQRFALKHPPERG
ncbi:MAG: DNA mismatch repair protein [Myxococcales bacterium]|nr:DNA mismatch repair protein [Myxococcales bacterium]